ncbi:hypothetical protein BS17DRAFT_442522 [Gyrodon lividus]|nr:hypothetical protein BS17DRAFT_442522 [Gyrodon lividus]
MRREASPQGLILKPTDIVWVPADLDFGTRDSMSAVWSTIEYLPVLHQVSFSGAGENARRGHLFQPRRIIPGQKIHASILFADAYRPVANLGSGFSIPIRSPSDTELDSELWETGFFDNTTAGQLITCLGRQERDAPVYLDRLLFMLRFPEGKASIRKVPNWQKTFEDLVKQRSGFIKLVMIVAYFEASYEELHRGSPAPGLNFPKEVFDHARQCFKGILASHKHRDFPRAVALLRPLTKHEVLRQQILMPDVIITLIRLLDEILDNPDEKFSQIMNGLGCLVECNDLQDTVVQQLGSESTRWTKNRLSRMLGVDDLNHLTASLRVIVSIARIQKVVDACAMVKPRLRELARQHKGLIGQMAVEALLELYNPAEEEQLAESLHNSNVLANLTSTLNLLNIEISQDSSSSSGHRNGRTSHQLLGQIFGLGQ